MTYLADRMKERSSQVAVAAAALATAAIASQEGNYPVSAHLGVWLALIYIWTQSSVHVLLPEVGAVATQIPIQPPAVTATAGSPQS